MPLNDFSTSLLTIIYTINPKDTLVFLPHIVLLKMKSIMIMAIPNRLWQRKKVHTIINTIKETELTFCAMAYIAVLAGEGGLGGCGSVDNGGGGEGGLGGGAGGGGRGDGPVEHLPYCAALP